MNRLQAAEQLRKVMQIYAQGFDDEQAMEDELFAENADSDIDPYDMYDLLEQEDEYAEADWAAVSGEVGK